MFMNDTQRELNIVEALYNGVTIGKFVDMHTANRILGNLANCVSYRFPKVSEQSQNKLFWELINKGFVLEVPKELTGNKLFLMINKLYGKQK